MIKLSELPEDVSLDDIPDDEEIVLDEQFPRYLLDPFEVVSPDDSRYSSAYTREQLNRMK